MSINAENIHDNYGIIGNIYAPVTIFITGDKNVIQQVSINNSPVKIDTNINTNTNTIPCESECDSAQGTALLSIFKKLDVIKQAQLLTYAVELSKE